MKLDSILLETSRRPIGLGYTRQVWPQTVHHIVRIGTREARVIVPNEFTPSTLSVVSLIVSGLILS